MANEAKYHLFGITNAGCKKTTVEGTIQLLECNNLSAVLYPATFEEKDLFVDESILTGESKEVRKISVKNPESENYNDENLLFMGSFIVNGKCIARVANTGMKTKFGKIAKMISVAEKENEKIIWLKNNGRNS